MMVVYFSITSIVLAIMFTIRAWKMAHPGKSSRLLFWVVLLLACAFIGLTIGFIGSWLIRCTTILD